MSNAAMEEDGSVRERGESDTDAEESDVPELDFLSQATGIPSSAFGGAGSAPVDALTRLVEAGKARIRKLLRENTMSDDKLNFEEAGGKIVHSGHRKGDPVDFGEIDGKRVGTVSDLLKPLHGESGGLLVAPKSPEPEERPRWRRVSKFRRL